MSKTDNTRPYIIQAEDRLVPSNGMYHDHLYETNISGHWTTELFRALAPDEPCVCRGCFICR